MLSLDVIEETNRYPWNNPIVTVKKKDGSMRLCLDARKLNTIVVPEAYPTPHIYAIMNNLGSSKYRLRSSIQANPPGAKKSSEDSVHYSSKRSLPI